MTQTIIHVPASEGGGSFDPTDIEITDGVDDAFLIKDTSGDEWFKIDTRTGTGENCINMAYTGGQKVLIGKPNSASNGPFSPFQVVNGQNSSYAVRLYGDTTAASDNQFAWGRDNQQTLWVHPLGGRFDSSSSSGSFEFRNSSSLSMLTMDDNTNATFTLNDSNSAVFKVQDDAGSPTEFLKITSTTGARDVRLQTGHSNQYVFFNQTGWYSQFRNGNNNQVYLQGNDTMELYGKFCTHRQFSGGFFRTMNAGNTIQLFAVEENSNTTFRLNAATPGKFIVQDSGASHNYIEVDSTSSSEVITLQGRPGVNSKLVMNHDPYLQGGNNQSVQMASFGVQTAVSNSGHRIINKLGNSTNYFQVSDSGNAAIFKVEEDSSATYTLDDGSGATFTITDDNATPKLHFRCTQSAAGNPYIEVNGVQAFPTKQLTLLSTTYGTAFQGSINQSRLSVSLGATSTTRNINIGAVNMDVFAQILTATPSTTGQTFTLDFNNTSTALSGLPIGLYKLVLKNAGTQSCTFTAASTMASGGRVKGVDVSGASIGVIDSSSGSITAAAGEAIYVEVTNHVSDSAGGNSNRFIICKTICKI